MILPTMTNNRHIMNIIFDFDLDREICKMLILRAASDKFAFEMVLDACVSTYIPAKDLANYIVKLGKNDPIFRLVQNKMNEGVDQILGVA